MFNDDHLMLSIHKNVQFSFGFNGNTKMHFKRNSVPPNVSSAAANHFARLDGVDMSGAGLSVSTLSKRTL